MKASGTIRKKRGTWWARINYKDPLTGKRRDVERKARTKTEAADIRDQMMAELRATNGASVTVGNLTFKDLADLYRKTYLIPPRYIDDQKVDGLRGYKTLRSQLKPLEAHFGIKRVKEISYLDLREFRLKRLDQKVRGKQRSLAAVHRELSLMRRMLNIAKQMRWIVTNPFELGDSLIRPANEVQRQRILTADEEKALIAACSDEQRLHLKTVVICALDTGMRLGEILKLEWADVDLDAGLLHVQTMNTKTLRPREIGLTLRLSLELRKHRLRTGADLNGGVFGKLGCVKRSFTTARRIAKLENVRFHDLRHTAATRLVQGGLSLPEVGRVLGHTEPRTTYRYTNLDVSTRQRAAEILTSYQTSG